MSGLLQQLKRHPRLYNFLRYGLYARLRSANRAKVFEQIYEKNLWDGEQSVSGPGSSLESTFTLRQELPKLIESLHVRSFLDIPCGDYQWMKDTPLGVEEYIGADIVLGMVEKNQRDFGAPGRKFAHLDLLSDALPTTDMVFCRDCMVHLSFREIRLAFKMIANAGPQYVMLTTFPELQKNEDTVTPYWRALNFRIDPFNFPEPIQLIKDFADTQRDHQGKYLGVWRFDDLRPLLDGIV
jgi:hypothetical protein